MSINNAPFKQKLNTTFFSANNNVSPLIKKHNFYIGTYSPDKTTTEDLVQLIINEDSNSNSFYADEDVKKILQQCLLLQKQWEKVISDTEEARKLGRLKDSYWENIATLFKNGGSTDPYYYATGVAGVSLVAAGLVSGILYLALGITAIAVCTVPIAALAIGLIALTAVLIKACQEQKKANNEYIAFLDGKDFSFFGQEKQRLEEEAKDMQVPELGICL